MLGLFTHNISSEPPVSLFSFCFDVATAATIGHGIVLFLTKLITTRTVFTNNTKQLNS